MKLGAEVVLTPNTIYKSGVLKVGVVVYEGFGEGIYHISWSGNAGDLSPHHEIYLVVVG